jgi:mannosyl-glycoprotein endo-beta-N-acetylglucosaminidase
MGHRCSSSGSQNAGDFVSSTRTYSQSRLTRRYFRIFEGSGESDILRLLFGRLPSSVTGPAQSEPTPDSFRVSPHYARALADLARQRGFDGYLLNVECPLRGGPEQARALTAWIGLLRYYLKTEVGGHAEVIWFDSVIHTGKLAWQDRLNHNNVVFYPPSTGFFTNYSVGSAGTSLWILSSSPV